jgi:single-strand DNA-binding protein
MNTAQFSGNLTKDVRQPQSNSGMALAFFTVAVNSGYGDKKHVDYIECRLFGKRAEGGLIQYLTKGQQVIVTGTVTLESREHNDKTYTNMSLNVQELDLIGSKGDREQAPQQKAAPDAFAEIDDGLPF